MKKFIFFVLLFSSLLSAQGVDLPDFVISGSENVTLPKIKKAKPKLVLPLGKSYFRHKFTPEDFSVSYIAELDTNYVLPIKRNRSFSQYATLLAGINYLPKADVFWGFPIKNGYLNFKFIGENRLNYLPHSERSYMDGNVNLRLYTNYSSKNIPLSYFDIYANGNLHDYRFFASASPSYRRKYSLGGAGVKFHSFSKSNLNLSADISANDFRLLKENFIEQNIDALFSVKKKFSLFSLLGNFHFVNQKLKDNQYKKFNYFDFLIAGELYPYETFAIRVGANFAHSGGRNFFAPYLFGKVILTDNLVMTGGWSSSTAFISNSDMIQLNPYYSRKEFTNVFQSVYNKIHMAFYYSYLEYFDASFIFGFKQTDGMVYFGNDSDNIHYIPKTINAVNGFFTNIKFNFYSGRFGFFSGEINVDREVNAENYLIPYHPVFCSKANYNYRFNFGLLVSLGLNYYSRSYTNLSNNSSIAPYINLFASSDYKIANNLKFILRLNNLLNRENYYFTGYREPLMDFTAGVEYFWR